MKKREREKERETEMREMLEMEKKVHFQVFKCLVDILKCYTF